MTNFFLLITLIKGLKGHKSIQTLCYGPETPKQWTSESVIDELTNGQTWVTWENP